MVLHIVSVTKRKSIYDESIFQPSLAQRLLKSSTIQKTPLIVSGPVTAMRDVKVVADIDVFS